MTYARRTKVPVEKSRQEIETIVSRAGATAFGYSSNQSKAQIQFELKDRVIRFVVPFPTEESFGRVKRGGRLVTIPFNQRAGMRERCIKERWRALKIAILAKLESIAVGIEQFDEAFLSQIVDPITNRTVYEVLHEQLTISYSDNPKPLGLPSPDDPIDVESTKIKG